MTIAYLTKNFYDYDPIFPPPGRLPEDLISIYLTDSEKNKEAALAAGWQRAYVYKDFPETNDKLARRMQIGSINCYPEKYIKDLLDFDKVFVSDPNIIKLDSSYHDFIKSSREDIALYTMQHLDYDGKENNIAREMARSYQPRWRYNWDQMRTNTDRYLREFQEKGINFLNVPVICAKYFGWNMKKKSSNPMPDKFWEEYNKHLQGNIILSYLFAMNPNDVSCFFNVKRDEVLVRLHRYEG